MILILYNLLLPLAAFIWIPWMLLRAKARKEPPNWQQRAGDYQDLPKAGRNPKRIWIHAVSVGEVIAVKPVLEELRRELPNWEIVLSVTTSTGHETAREKAKGLFDHLVYFPIDLPRFTLRALSRVKPSAVAVMETELWLNFLWTARQLEIPTFLINGRISQKNYSRSRLILPYYMELFRHLDHPLVQSEGDRKRITKLGARGAQVLGNCKFDQALASLEGSRDEWRARIGAGPDDLVLVIGSTRGEEEENFVLESLKQSVSGRQNIRLVWAPRHLEKVEALASRLQALGWTPSLRSKGEEGPCLILDTFGELAPLYSAADIAVIGGGFAKFGGQNLIQPMAHGVPVLHGPHMGNFRDAVDQAQAAGASLTCQTPEELSNALRDLLDNADKRRAMGEAGRRVVESGRGASKAYAQAIASAARSCWKDHEEAIAETARRKASKK